MGVKKVVAVAMLTTAEEAGLRYALAYCLDTLLRARFRRVRKKNRSLLRGPNVRLTSMRTFSAYVEWDPETQLYVGVIPGVAGAHSQGVTLDELQKNMKEVLELCLEEYKGALDDLPHFVGLQQVEVAV